MSQRQKPIGIEAEESYSVELVHTHWINIKHRELWIHGTILNADQDYEGREPGVEYMMATRIIKNLHSLRHQSTKEPVLIHLHTLGGMYQEGMALYNTIKFMPYPVTIISYTTARSMSSIVLQAADRRVIMPDSYFMYHMGTNSFSGEYQTFQSNAEFDKVAAQRMIDIYVEKALHGKKFQGWSEKKIRSFLIRQLERKHDVFLTPEEAVNHGFADEVFNGDWNDLKKFEKQ